MTGAAHRRASFWIVGAAILGSATAVHAWGYPAHRLIAAIAATRLNAATSRAVAALAGDESLAHLSTWADEIRPQRPDTKRWHYVDIPRSASTYVAARDCARLDEGDCLLAALDRSAAVLRSRTTSFDERRDALRWLVHLVGDLHQPLHCTDDDDAGGNRIAVRFLGSSRNLHAVWDGDLLDAAISATPGFRSRVVAAARALPAARTVTFVGWALETHAVGAAHVYGDLPADRRLAASYVVAHAPIVERQLARAGARLGDVLNLLLSPRRR